MWNLTISVIAAVVLSATLVPAQTSTSSQSDIQKRVNTAATVLDQIMATPDKAIPDKLMEDAHCVIVIPSMIRIAVGFGGQHGKGVAVCRTVKGWSGPAPVTLTGGSWGLQLGGEAVDVVMLVMNKKGIDELLASKFKIGVMRPPLPDRSAGTLRPLPIGKCNPKS